MAEENSALGRVALAISAYRSDESVLRLLEEVFAAERPQFGAVIVVDSLGSGEIERAAEERGWTLHYINSERNLGSAGNLDLRLRTAADLSFDWCQAVNHDGDVSPERVLELLARAGGHKRVGAIYPQLVFTRAGGQRDRPRHDFSPYTRIGGVEQRDGCVEVAWSSSNGALYNLQPIRNGVTAWSELWMGYEDLALGWELKRRGWNQLLCTDVPIPDDYEFRPVRLLGKTIHLAAKPSWYMYYQQRNLVLIARRSGGEAVGMGAVLLRLVADVALILGYRDRKTERLRLLFGGLLDGLRGRDGKAAVP